MAKKRMKALTIERALELDNFSTTLERITSFEPEIKVNNRIFIEPTRLCAQEDPLYLCVFLDRKNRELRSTWARGGYIYEFSSPSVVLVAFFDEKYTGEQDPSLFLAEILVNRLADWSRYDKECKEERALHPVGAWYLSDIEEPKVFHYPPKNTSSPATKD